MADEERRTRASASGGQGDDGVSDASSVCEDDTRGLLSAHQTPSQEARTRHQDSAEQQEGLSPGLAEEDEELAEELAYTAAHVTSILKPVTVTMALVVWIVKMTEQQLRDERLQSPYLVYRERDTDDSGTRIGKAVVNALVIVMAILCFTVLFFFLYKYRCLKVLYGWLCLSVAMLLGFSGGALFYTLIVSFYDEGAGYFPAIDTYSFMLVQYNFAVVGVAVVFWKSPLIIKQVYLVIASCIMAWVLSRFFPEWTVWALLAALSFYDIFAVLSTCGPLKALVELSQDRGDVIPGLIYEAAPPERSTKLEPVSSMTESLLSCQPPTSEERPPQPASVTHNASPLRQRDRRGDSSRSEVARGEGPTTRAATRAAETPAPQAEDLETGVAGAGGQGVRGEGSGDLPRREGVRAGRPSSDTSRATNIHVPTTPLGGSHISMPAPSSEDEDDRGVKLGLGDFVFYSVLIGRAAIYDFTTVVTCFYAILTGLILTLFCLAVFRRALPALPLSIFLGIATFAITKVAVMPLMQSFALHQFAI